MNALNCQIVLSIYNGEHYLKEQLDSLFLQTNQQWTLLVRDDGSTDGSAQIIEQYAKKYPNRIAWLKDNAGNLGCLISVTTLMKATTADYVFVCDQDDYWLTDKVQSSLDAFKTTEQLASKSTPLVLHTDFKLGDAQLTVQHESFFQKCRLKHEKLKSLTPNMLATYFTGPTMLVNRALINELKFPPKDLAYRNLQDWWYVLHALSLGKIITLVQPTIIYRQHDSYFKRDSQKSAIKNIGRLAPFLMRVLPTQIIERFLGVHSTLLISRQIIPDFLNTLEFGNPAYNTCKTYVEISNQGFLGRKWGFIRQGYHRQTWFKTLVVFCLF